MCREPQQVGVDPLAAVTHASNLTSREAEIARLVSRGLRNKEIARELHLSEGTVKMHLHNIYEKLHLGGRMQLALWMAGACARRSVSGIEAGLLEELDRPDFAAPTLVA